jgi:8-oxo-dGTP pyrophosphatase MutT (NUDIX family)
MGTPRRWEVVETEQLQECRVFSVSRSMARSPLTGETHPFFRIEADEWVNVVPVTPDDELVMVRQYRHGSREITLEIPGGIVDPGEAPAEAAARELLEETGYRAERVEAIGSVNPNPALFGNRCHTFLASEVAPVAAIQNTQLEETSVELVPMAEIPDQLRQGRIDHALVVAALYWYALDRQARRSGGAASAAGARSEAEPSEVR